jgi:tetratricopeptide (TPR) repeat protein
MGNQKPLPTVKSSNIEDFSEFINKFTKALDGINAILIFDDFQNCDKQTLEFFSTLKKISAKINGPNIIITSRRKRKFYDQRDVSITKSILEIQLAGLDLKSSKKLINIEEINEDRLEYINNVLKGHPVALQLMESVDSVDYKGNFRTFIEDEVFNKLNDDQKEMLGIACVFRYPVLADALYQMNSEINYETLCQLQQRFLISQTTEDSYFMHELLSNIYYRRLTPEQKKSVHIHAAKYFQDKENIIDIMERIYHLVNAKEFDEGAEIIIRYSDKILFEGYPGFSELLKSFNKKNTTTKYLEKISGLIGELLTVSGNWDLALKYYKHQLERLDGLDETYQHAEIYDKIGTIYGEKGDLEKNIEYLEKSIKIYQMGNNKKQMAMAYNNLGLNYRFIGNNKKALDMYERCLEIFLEINEKEGISILYNNIGRTYEYMNKPKKAIEYYNYGIAASKDCNFQLGMAIGYKLLGLGYYSKKNINKAKKFLNQSLECFKDSSDCDNIFETNLALAEICYNDSDFSNAIDIYLTCVDILQEKLNRKIPKSRQIIKWSVKSIEDNTKVGMNDNLKQDRNILLDKLTISKLYEKIGNIYRSNDKFEEARNYHTKHLEIAQELNDDLEIAMAQINLGIDHRKLKSFDLALDSYNTALKKLNQINDKIGILTVHRNIGKIHGLKKDYDAALSHYEKSLKMAEEIQYETGIINASSEIGKLLLRKGEKRRGEPYLKMAWELRKKK